MLILISFIITFIGWLLAVILGAGSDGIFSFAVFLPLIFLGYFFTREVLAEIAKLRESVDTLAADKLKKEDRSKEKECAVYETAAVLLKENQEEEFINCLYSLYFILDEIKDPALYRVSENLMNFTDISKLKKLTLEQKKEIALYLLYVINHRDLPEKEIDAFFEPLVQ